MMPSWHSDVLMYPALHIEGVLIHIEAMNIQFLTTAQTV